MLKTAMKTKDFKFINDKLKREYEFMYLDTNQI